MTAQIPERIKYNGAVLSMCSEPLSQYFSLAKISPGFAGFSTALWRGYIGTWEIIDDRLYLTSLEGQFEDGSDASLASLFPDFPDRAFAHWYSGTLRIPKGKLLEYVHMGYGSRYEVDQFICIEKGCITRTYEKANGTADDASVSEGYQVAAMTILRKPKQ